MRGSSSAAIPVPVSWTMRLARCDPSSVAATESRMRSSGWVCWTAFSSSASTASPRRSASASATAGSRVPSCQHRSAAARQRSSTSAMKWSSSTGSGRRKSGLADAAMSSSRSLRARSRFSSPTTTWMSRLCCWLTSLVASSSECPRAIVMGVLNWWDASCRNRRWLVSSRSFSWLTLISSASAAWRRRPCQNMTQNKAAISGTSVSSSGGWVPRSTSAPIAAKVVAHIAIMCQNVRLALRTRKLYSSAKVIQIRWNGIDSQRWNSSMPPRPRNHSRTQVRFTQPAHERTPSRSGRVTTQRSTPMRSVSAGLRSESIPCTAHRLDQLETKLGPQPPDAHVDDVRSRVEIDAPHRGQQRALGDRLAGVIHQRPQQQNLEPGQRHRPEPGVCLHPAEVESQPPGSDNVASRLVAWLLIGPQLHAHSGQQLVQGERLGQVVLGARIEQIDLGGDVGQARQDEDALVGPKTPKLPEHLAT